MPERAEIEALVPWVHWQGGMRGKHNCDFAVCQIEPCPRLRALLDRVRDARGDDEAVPSERPAGEGGSRMSSWSDLSDVDHGPARSPQGEDHEASELAKFQEDLTRALNRHGVPAMPSWDAAIDWLAEHAIRSPRRKDHEAGKRAALDAVAELRMHGGPNGGWKDLALGEVVDIAIDAYLSCASPYRDGTVAVEDVTEWLRVRSGRTHGNGASSALYAAARDLRAEFGSARAGESNEGGNQNDERRH